MQDHDDDNPYRVSWLIDDRETRAFFFGIRAAKICAILPFVYMIAEIIELERIGWYSDKVADQHTIFIVGTWFYALISIPAAILIIFRASRAGLCYGIIINKLFAFCALLWLCLFPMTREHDFPELFGIPIFLMRVLYVVMYVGTIYVYIKAWRYLDWEKR